jgi:hypothetical protein
MKRRLQVSLNVHMIKQARLLGKESEQAIETMAEDSQQK